MRIRHRAAMLAALAAIGCSQVQPVDPFQPESDPSRLFQRLTMNYPAVVMSTQAGYNTLQLTATAWDAAGNVIADVPAPIFHTTDTTSILLASDGAIQAIKPATQARVVVELVLNGVRHADTTVVNITDLTSPPKLASLSIHVPPDQAQWYAGQSIAAFLLLFARRGSGDSQLAPVALDSSGNTMADLPLEYTTLDPTLVSINRRTGVVSPLRVGQARVVVKTMAYGIPKADTATYVVQPPLGADFTFNSVDGRRWLSVGAEPQLLPLAPRAKVVAGGVVLWVSNDSSPADVVFDDPTNVADAPPELCDLLEATLGVASYCGAGNIPAFTGSSSQIAPDGTAAIRVRMFPVPGSYPFHSALSGAAGVVEVLAPAPLPQ